MNVNRHTLTHIKISPSTPNFSLLLQPIQQPAAVERLRNDFAVEAFRIFQPSLNSKSIEDSSSYQNNSPESFSFYSFTRYNAFPPLKFCETTSFLLGCSRYSSLRPTVVWNVPDKADMRLIVSHPLPRIAFRIALSICFRFLLILLFVRAGIYWLSLICSYYNKVICSI